MGPLSNVRCLFEVGFAEIFIVKISKFDFLNFRVNEEIRYGGT
jgi:hypothetical protein